MIMIINIMNICITRYMKYESFENSKSLEVHEYRICQSLIPFIDSFSIGFPYFSYQQYWSKSNDKKLK